MDHERVIGEEFDVVFVFADLSGYTALTEAHGNVHAAHVVSRYVELAESVLTGGARLFERVGDEVVIVAPDARAAIRTAVGLRDAIAREPLFPMVRAGMHAGAVVEHAGRYVGAALNLASRVAGQAIPGQILCTERVVRLAGDVPGIAYKDLGNIRLKNVRHPVSLFEVVATATDAAATIVDPVCRMQIVPGAAVAEATIGGRRYLFCSIECRDVFLADAETL